MRAYSISGDDCLSATAAIEIAKAFAITGLYKQADSLPILMQLRLVPYHEAEKQLRSHNDVTLGMLSQSIKTEMASLLYWLDRQQSADVVDAKLFF